MSPRFDTLCPANPHPTATRRSIDGDRQPDRRRQHERAAEDRRPYLPCSRRHARPARIPANPETRSAPAPSPEPDLRAGRQSRSPTLRKARQRDLRIARSRAVHPFGLIRLDYEIVFPNEFTIHVHKTLHNTQFCCIQGNTACDSQLFGL